MFSCNSPQGRAASPSGPAVTFHSLLAPPTDLQAFVLSSVELQVLTGSCFKLRTVHNIPVTSNKDGKIWNLRLPNQQVQPPLPPATSPQGTSGAFHKNLARHLAANICSLLSYVGMTQLQSIQRARTGVIHSPNGPNFPLMTRHGLKEECGTLVCWDCVVNMFTKWSDNGSKSGGRVDGLE